MNERELPVETVDAAILPPGGDQERDKLAFVQWAVLRWFEANRRDLPWRHTRDPYAVLVSEVMLQQIQVARAIPFYEAFMARFPTVQTLAAAPLADAIRAWGDLGRYRRVVNLHRTARLIVEEHGGVVPRPVDILRRLPGIGPYTAGAVACFAYEDPVAFVDTNMRRVLRRLFLGAGVDESTDADKRILRLAEAAVPRDRAWEWNQGLMEFGALQCTARRPRCDSCPLRARCSALPGIERERPASRPRPSGGAPAYRYEESNRYYRGRILAQLRDRPRDDARSGIPLRDLGRRLRTDFGDEDLPWLTEVVAGLRKDGLAVAEDRPGYDPGGDDETPLGDLSIRLP
jgi:A/G-specific adenine glycosylase